MKTKQGHEVSSKKHARAIEDAVAGRNYMVHAKYLYACNKCKEIEPIYLGTGVEGPDDLRAEGLYIASPFGGPPCKECGGQTSHVFFGSDEHFELTSAVPTGALCFIIPKSGINMRFFNSSVFCGKTIRANEAKK